MIKIKWNISYISIGVLVLLALLASVMFFKPELATSVQEMMGLQKREVLATVQADLRFDGTILQVVKLREKNHLALEFFVLGTGGTTEFLQRLDLPDKKDGYFRYKGRVANLIVDDINGDGKVELLAPGYDSDLIAHLNVIRFDPATNQFVIVTPGK